MKRIISLCCVALILVMGVSVPVQAAEIDNSLPIDVLEYNPDKINILAVTTSSNMLSLRLPKWISVRYIDCVVTISGSTVSGVSAYLNGTTSNLTLNYIGNWCYRIYGYVGGSSDSLGLIFNTSGTSYVTFQKCEVSTNIGNRYDIEAYCEIASAEFNQVIHYVPTDEINHRMFAAVSEYSDTYFMTYIWSDDWKKYDYIDFQLMYDVFDITSITAVMGSTNVPLEISIFDGTNIEGNSYYLSMRMDVTGLDRVSDDYPMIVIMGRLDAGVINSIDFVNCSGYVSVAEYSSLYYYLLNIWNSISAGATSITNSLNTHFTNLKTDLSTHFSSLDSWIKTQSTAIQTQFTQLKTALSTHFTNLTTAIQTQFTQLKTALNTHFSNLSSWISQQTATLDAAIRGDTAPGNSFQVDVSDKDEQLDDMAEVMDSVTKPAIKDINVSVNQYVKPADMQLLATPLNAFFEADLFRTMIIMSILLATVSFTLYGKR